MGGPSETVIRLLGPVEVAVEGRTLRLRGPVLTSLFVRLALHRGHPVPDDVLFETIWGDDEWADDPVAALRTSVTRVRKAIEPIGWDIVRAGDGYALSEPARLDLDDLDEFERCAQHDAGAVGLDAAADALALWRGPSATGIRQTPYGRGFAAQLDRRRSLLEDRWAELAVGLGHGRRALAFLEGSVRVEPTNELRWSLLARARAQVGRARDGLLAIEAAKEQLMDVGLLPGRQLLLAEQAILSTPLDVALEDAHGLDARPVDARDVDARDGDRRHSVSAPAPLAARLPDELAALRAERFVARARPLELLDQALERVIGRGVSEVVVVVGEPGAGKTALVAEALARGLQERAEVHYGWAASRGGPAFGPWCTALRRAAVLDSTLFASPAGRVLADHLAGIESDGGRSELSPDDLAARRSQLIEEAATAVLALGRSGPTIIVTDDFHWADEVSAALMSRLASKPVAAPVLVVATERLGGVAQRLRGVQTITLERLAPVDIADWLGRTVDDPWTRQVVDHSGGLPLLVDTALRRGAAMTPTEHELRSELARSVLGECLDELGEAAVGTLVWASVLGSPFRFDDLRMVAGRSDTGLLDDLDDAARVAVVVFDQQDPELIRFAHHLMAVGVGETVSPPRRAQLHAEVVRQLAGRLAPLDQLHHARQAGTFLDADAAAAIAARAGKVLISGMQFEELRAVTDWSLSRLADLPPTAVEVALRIQRARALAGLEAFDEARRSLDEALTRAKVVNDPYAVAEALLARSIFGRRFTGSATLIAELRRAAAALAPEAIEQRFGLLAQIVDETLQLGDFDAVDEPMAQLHELVDRLARPSARVTVLRLEQLAAELRGNRLARLAAVAAIEQLGEEIVDHDVSALRYQARVVEALHSGRPEAADAHARDLAEHGRRGGYPLDEWLGLVFGFSAPFLRGDHEIASKAATTAFRRGRELGVTGAFGAFSSQRFALGWLSGELADFVEPLEGLAVEGPDLVWRAALALAFAACGDDRRSGAVLGECTDQVAAPVTSWLGFVGVAFAAEAASMIEYDAVSAAAQPLLERRCDDHVLLGSGAIDYGPAARYLGLCLAGTAQRARGLELLHRVAEAPASGPVWQAKAALDIERLAGVASSNRRAAAWWPTERTTDA